MLLRDLQVSLRSQSKSTSVAQPSRQVSEFQNVLTWRRIRMMKAVKSLTLVELLPHFVSVLSSCLYGPFSRGKVKINLSCVAPCGRQVNWTLILSANAGKIEKGREVWREVNLNFKIGWGGHDVCHLRAVLSVTWVVLWKCVYRSVFPEAWGIAICHTRVFFTIGCTK